MNKLTIQVSGERGHTDNYCAAIRGAGGEPVAGYCPTPNLHCDGLLLCGGGDLDPSLYGQEDRGSQPPDRARDQAELTLFQVFHEAGKPILGICRGIQVINVALGGTLIQDLSPERLPFHSGKTDTVHPLRTEEGSILHQLYGPLFSVNSAHHQALDRLGRGLRATAWAESGFPEAVELPGKPILGVQFHPERMSFGHRRLDAVDGAAIFTWFLGACGGDDTAFLLRQKALYNSTQYIGKEKSYG